MKTHSDISKYKLLVLIDTPKNSSKIIEDAMHLAKMINGSIDILQVESPLSVVKNPNQIAALRSFDQKRYAQEIALKELVSKIKVDLRHPVISNFTIGNVKNEIKNHIEKTKPIIVVLGKRKKKLGGLIGDSITKEILNTFTGNVFISDKEQGAAFVESQSIGFLDTIAGTENIALVNDLKQHHKKPLKVFKTVENGAGESEKALAKDTIVYEFDGNNKDVSDMTNFISKNNLAFLCVQKSADKKESFKRKLNNLLTSTIEKTNVPVLVLNTNIN